MNNTKALLKNRHSKPKKQRKSQLNSSDNQHLEFSFDENSQLLDEFYQDAVLRAQREHDAKLKRGSLYELLCFIIMSVIIVITMIFMIKYFETFTDNTDAFEF